MKEVLIDVTRLVTRRMQGTLPTGVDRVSLEYLRHFREYAVAVVRLGAVWMTFSPALSARLFDELLVSGRGQWQVLAWVLVRSCFSCRLGLPRGKHFFLNTGHSGIERPGYAAKLRKSGVRPLFFVHDLIPISHPEYSRPREADRHHRRLETMLSLGLGLITNSRHTREALENYAPRYGWPVPACIVAPLAPARLPPPPKERPLDCPYFVVLGTIEPRKNHLLLLHIWRDLVAKHGSAAPRLVVIGQQGWECEQVMDVLERCESLHGFVLEKPHCADAELSIWLHHAQALLLPSFAEGFGLPLVEALTAGVPVVASQLSVFREIARDIPEYLNPLDGIGWRRMILDYAAPNSPRRAAQLRRLESFRAPTWNDHFTLVDALIARIGAEGLVLAGGGLRKNKSARPARLGSVPVAGVARGSEATR